jgi:hypothetical protein
VDHPCVGQLWAAEWCTATPKLGGYRRPVGDRLRRPAQPYASGGPAPRLKLTPGVSPARHGGTQRSLRSKSCPARWSLQHPQHALGGDGGASVLQSPRFSAAATAASMTEAAGSADVRVAGIGNRGCLTCAYTDLPQLAALDRAHVGDGPAVPCGGNDPLLTTSATLLSSPAAAAVAAVAAQSLAPDPLPRTVRAAGDERSSAEGLIAMTAEQQYTILEAADLAGRSTATIRRRYQRGELTGAGPRPDDRTKTVYIPRSALISSGLLSPDAATDPGTQAAALERRVERQLASTREELVTLRARDELHRELIDQLKTQLRDANKVNHALVAGLLAGRAA